MNEAQETKVWLAGRLIDAREAVVSIASETALRGANVFEGIRAYRDPSSGWLGYLCLDDHLDRLMDSAQLMGIEHDYSVESFRSAIGALVDSGSSNDLYVRPSICLVGGRVPSDRNYRAVDYVACAAVPRKDLLRGCGAIVSKWRRPSNSSLPTLAKSGGGYLAFRLPLLERVRAGVEHVIVLNEQGQLSEAEGAAVVVIRSGGFVTPPACSGALRSITLAIVIEIARSLGIQVRREPVSHAELLTADGAFLAGTLCELSPLDALDDVRLGTTELNEYQSVAAEFDRLRSGQAVGGHNLVPLA